MAGLTLQLKTLQGEPAERHASSSLLSLSARSSANTASQQQAEFRARMRRSGRLSVSLNRTSRQVIFIVRDRYEARDDVSETRSLLLFETVRHGRFDLIPRGSSAAFVRAISSGANELNGMSRLIRRSSGNGESSASSLADKTKKARPRAEARPGQFRETIAGSQATATVDSYFSRPFKADRKSHGVQYVKSSTQYCAFPCGTCQTGKPRSF